MPSPHGFIDNLFITADGQIVIAEAKLWRNPQARREVVAQALDYASCLFRMSYTEFESAALRGQFGAQQKPPSLWELVPDAVRLPEPEFVDAVSWNLKRGRIVVLAVGDGIREGTEQLVEVLQSHAGFRFTFALVELSVFSLPGVQDRLVIPRTLLRTQMVERGGVRIEDGHVSVAPVRPAPTAPAVNRFSGNISAEEFFDTMRAGGTRPTGLSHVPCSRSHFSSLSTMEMGWRVRWWMFSWKTARWYSPAIKMKACVGGVSCFASQFFASS